LLEVSSSVLQQARIGICFTLHAAKDFFFVCIRLHLWRELLSLHCLWYVYCIIVKTRRKKIASMPIRFTTKKAWISGTT